MDDADDHGAPTSYLAVQKGTPVLTAEGREFGRVRKVLQVQVKNVFDGIVVRTDDGDRFVDGPDVGRLYERAVFTTLDDEQVARLPRPGNPVGARAGRAKRRMWRRLVR